MAIIRNAANTMMKGRVGQTTYYISKGQQVARQSRNDSNYGETARRTELQQNRRVMWANLVNFYKISARWMPKAFESKKPGQTDYNKFMAVNVPTARIALTKSESEAGGCVVDGYLVSQGSLPSIEMSQTTTAWKTNIGIGELQIGAQTTIGDLTTAMLNNNANIREGMQISFVSYQQSIDPLGTPRAICRCYELTLIADSTLLVRDYLPDFASTSVEGFLGTNDQISTGGFAYILSELQGGALKVSTQLLQTNNAAIITQYSSAAQIKAAAKSYGVDSEVILNPNGTVAQGSESVPAFIISVQVGDGDTYAPGEYFGTYAKMYGQNVIITMSGMENRTVSQVTIQNSQNQQQEATNFVQNGNTITCQFSVTQDSNKVLKSLDVWTAGGDYIRGSFSTQSSGDMG